MPLPSLFAHLAARHNPVSPEARREFLKQSLLAGSALLLSSCGVPMQVGAPPPPTTPAWGARRVVVIGAGLAGLAAAYELASAGCDVTVLEATGRLGGRVMSYNKELKSELVPGKNVEAGAELIGSNHPLWVAYAHAFNLEFLDVSKDDGADFPIYVGGVMLRGKDSEKLYADLEALFATLNADARSIDPDRPWLHKDAAALDAKSLADWLSQAKASDLTKAAASAALSGDNGVANHRASYLGMLTAIKGGGIENYWTQTEVFRCKDGNQRLALRLAAKLGPRLHLHTPVTSIELSETRALVRAAGDTSFVCDDVVLAVPPTVWNTIAMTPDLPKPLRHADGVQMGVNVKYLSHVERRFWRDQKNSAQALTDGEVSWTWDATDGQEDTALSPHACLTAFAGGPAAERMRSRDDNDARGHTADLLNQLYPGYNANVVSARLIDWPAFPTIQGGYSFPAPGQVTTAGPMLAKPHAQRLHFAGEHCCYKFVGYMEGALQSGVSVARRLAGA